MNYQLYFQTVSREGVAVYRVFSAALNFSISNIRSQRKTYHILCNDMYIVLNVDFLLYACFETPLGVLPLIPCVMVLGDNFPFHNQSPVDTFDAVIAAWSIFI